MVVVSYLRRPRWFRLVAVAMAVTVAQPLLVGLPALAAAGLARPAPVHDASVPGTAAGTRPLAPDPAEQKAVRTAPTATVWPAAGSATVDLPRPVSTSAVPAAARVGRAKAGSLPVSVGPATTAGTGLAAQDATGTPGRVRVSLLGRRGDALLLRVDRADGLAGPARVSMEVDYSAFRDTYGGDWATRLRLVTLPDCAATTPDQPSCVGTPVATLNNGSGRLSGDVPVGGLLAVAAAASGPAGDFGASSMSPSATWQAGGSSGDFTWTYPMRVPPAPGGLVPELTLSYNSGNVDGRTSGTNNQPSWIGEGMEFTPGGYVERRYTPCSADMKPQNGQKPNNTTKTGDLCWGNDNLFYSVNGQGGELVRDDATGTWHPRVDDGSRVEQLYNTGLGNGTKTGEYWRITNRQGVQYYFGLNKLPGWATGNTQTMSTWTVPVFGNHPGEPCHASTFDASSCAQGWRWNLDYVVDPHNNTMSYFYKQETNNYGRNLTASKVSTYVRGGYLEHIEYGQRAGAVYTTSPVGKVLFSVADRCIPGTTCDTAHSGNWPDVPWDQSCTSSTSCSDKYTPTFWTQKRLASVKTQVWGGTAMKDVDRWDLTPQYPDPGDGTKPRLWLDSLQRTGLVGGSVALPPVTFEGTQLPNRVDGTDHIPAMDWWRMKAIRNESGDEIRVNYSPQECNYQTNLPAPDTNGLRCYPLRWTPDGLTEQTDWFNKYVVTEVSESDRTTGFEPEISDVTYVGPAAWRHDEEDGLVPEDRKTWSQWRGYGTVEVRKGRVDQPRSLTRMVFFRGMDGDATATAGVTKSVEVTDSTNTSWPDTDQFAGSPREVTTYLSDGGPILNRSITDPWLSAPTATRVRSWGTTKAYQVQEQKVAQGELDGTQWRQTASTHTYAADGTLLQNYDQGDIADANDDTCTTYTYASNTTAWILEKPIEQRTTAGDCGRAPTGTQDVVSDERLYYDGSDTLGAAPVRGDITRWDEINGWANGAPTFLTTVRAGYDAYGRMLQSKDVYGQPQTTTYTPATGPVTKVVSTNALGQQTSTDYEPAWGIETGRTAADGERSDSAYDALGRLVSTWAPGRSRSANPTSPTYRYQYLVRNDAPSVVETATLEADGGYRTEFQLLDGKMRVRQTQDPSPTGGRVVTDTVYDSQGRKIKENGPYHNDAPPGTDLLVPDESLLPAQTVTTYDGAGRVTAEIFYSLGVEKYRTTYVHHLDGQDTIPPNGDTPTTQLLNAQGKLVELRQYKGATATGAYDSTRYTYTPLGQLASVTDPAGNVWTFQYDARGRAIQTVDPDQGTTTYTYGDANELLSVTAGDGTTLSYEYDSLGRKTAEHEGAVTGPKLAEWTYDKLPDGTAVPGLPVSATRYVNGQPYTSTVTKYDSAGRVLAHNLTIPATEGNLAGTYSMSQTYNIDGTRATATLPAVGGLPGETLTYAYNAQGLPTTLSGTTASGTTSYVTATGYTEYGEQNQLTLSAGGKSVYRDFTYETGTRRLLEAATRRDTAATLVSDVSYSYDAAGNILRISDAPDPATGSTTDTQCFNYDYLRRLIKAWTPGSGDCSAAPTASGLGGPAPYWYDWTFDTAGNRTSQTGTAPDGTTTTTTYTYNKPGTAQPHALQGATTTTAAGTTTNSYRYDPSGDLIQRTLAGVGQTLDWDVEGHLAKVTQNGKTTSYVYDPDGNRLISHDPDGATLYLGDTELHMDNGGGLVGTRYYSHNGQTVAMRNGATGKLSWLVSDQHGTAELAIDESTQAIQRQRHDPYGSPRGTGSTPVAGDRGFVGGITDASTGLTHLGAREYDPTTGRFISVDSQIDYEDPQQMNGYVYANNSPVTFTDPDGTYWVTKSVTTWKTVYHTVIRKIVRTFVILVTMVFAILFLASYIWISRVYEVFKTIVSYVRELIKTIVRVLHLIHVWHRDHDPKTIKQMASLAGQIDKLNAQGDAMARDALNAILLGRWVVDQIYQASVKALEAAKQKKKGHSFWDRVKDTFHSVTQSKWFQWTAAVAGIVGLFACGAVCVVIGGVGLAMAVAGTADSCAHQFKSPSCMMGVTSLALGGVGKGMGKFGGFMVREGGAMAKTWNPLRAAGGAMMWASGHLWKGAGLFVEGQGAVYSVLGTFT